MSKELLKTIIQEIIEKVPLEEEMSKKGIEILQIGSKKKAVCPFHGDTDPSLVLYEETEKHHAHCFGCGIHFDVVGFVHKWGEKFEKDWSFKKTILYFKNEYKISSIINQGEMDNSFLEETFSFKKENEATVVKSDYYLSSNNIRELLRNSPYPKHDLIKIKKYIKDLDSSFKENNIDSLKERQTKLTSFIKKIKNIRYSSEMKEYIENIKGNENSKLIVITDNILFKKLISEMVNKDINEENLFFIILKNESEKEKVKEIIKIKNPKKVFILGDLSYKIMFPYSLKNIDEVSNKEKKISNINNDLYIEIKEEKDIENLIKEIKKYDNN